MHKIVAIWFFSTQWTHHSITLIPSVRHTHVTLGNPLLISGPGTWRVQRISSQTKFQNKLWNWVRICWRLTDQKCSIINVFKSTTNWDQEKTGAGVEVMGETINGKNWTQVLIVIKWFEINVLETNKNQCEATDNKWKQVEPKNKQGGTRGWWREEKHAESSVPRGNKPIETSGRSWKKGKLGICQWKQIESNGSTYMGAIKRFLKNKEIRNKGKKMYRVLIKYCVFFQRF